MITVGVNGKLILRRCHLKGPLLVKTAVNGEVTIIDSTLEGQKGIVEVGGRTSSSPSRTARSPAPTTW